MKYKRFITLTLTLTLIFFSYTSFNNKYRQEVNAAIPLIPAVIAGGALLLGALGLGASNSIPDSKATYGQGFVDWLKDKYTKTESEALALKLGVLATAGNYVIDSAKESFEFTKGLVDDAREFVNSVNGTSSSSSLHTSTGSNITSSNPFTSFDYSAQPSYPHQISTIGKVDVNVPVNDGIYSVTGSVNMSYSSELNFGFWENYGSLHFFGGSTYTGDGRTVKTEFISFTSAVTVVNKKIILVYDKKLNQFVPFTDLSILGGSASASNPVSYGLKKINTLTLGTDYVHTKAKDVTNVDTGTVAVPKTPTYDDLMTAPYVPGLNDTATGNPDIPVNPDVPGTGTADGVTGWLEKIWDGILSIPEAIVNGLTSVLEGLRTLLQSILSVLSNLVSLDWWISLVVPSDTFWTSNFGNIKSVFLSKFPNVDFTLVDPVGVAKNPFDIDITLPDYLGGKTVKAINIVPTEKLRPYSLALTSGVIYILLGIYSYNQVYFLVRGTYPISNFKFGGSGEGTTGGRGKD